jgi:hypothetical protein
MAATKTSAIERLAELDQAIVDAEARRDAIHSEQRAANQAVAQAKAKLLDAEERRGAGESVDAEISAIEETLAQAVEVADVRTEPGGSVMRRGGPDAEPAIQNLPERTVPNRGLWSARLAGAERVIEEAILARDQFGRNHFAELAAEEVPADAEARDALVEAWEVLRAAGNAYAVRVRRWHRLARYADLDPAAIPLAPLTGDMIEVAQRFEAGLEVPTPRVLR